MPSLQPNQTRIGPRKHLEDIVDTVENLAAECLNKKAIKKCLKRGNEYKKKQSTKGDHIGKGHKDRSKIKCFNCGKYGNYARDCLKACDHSDSAQESEQNKKVANMLDMGNSSVSKECAMMCMEVQREDQDEDLVVYRDQGISTEEYDKASYGELTKTQSKEEEEVKCNMALCTNDSVSLEKKRR